jgi:hypothetical protein
MVQNGKLAASALALATTALNKVDFPTLGSPTIPALSIVDFKFWCQVSSIRIIQTGGDGRETGDNILGILIFPQF